MGRRKTHRGTRLKIRTDAAGKQVIEEQYVEGSFDPTMSLAFSCSESEVGASTKSTGARLVFPLGPNGTPNGSPNGTPNGTPEFKSMGMNVAKLDLPASEPITLRASASEGMEPPRVRTGSEPPLAKCG